MSTKGRQRFTMRRTLLAAGVFVLFTGMLFWTKLRLVSDIPRSAYAVPKEDASETGEEPDQQARDREDDPSEPESP